MTKKRTIISFLLCLSLIFCTASLNIYASFEPSLTVCLEGDASKIDVLTQSLSFKHDAFNTIKENRLDRFSYTLLESQNSKSKVCIFIADIEGLSDPSAKILEIYSKFSCYRDYFPCLLIIKANNFETLKPFDDGDLSFYSGSAQKGVYVFSSNARVQIKNDKISLECKNPSKAIDLDKKFIALTYDDGPTQVSGRTDAVLDAFDRFNVKATFFVLGSRLTKGYKKQRNLLLRAHLSGHEIGNHTFSHKSYPELEKSATIKDEICATDALIYEITGAPATLLRAPGGIVKSKTDLDRPLINWSIDTLDWQKTETVQSVVATVKNNAGDKKIVLMHDITTKTADATHKILEYLLSNDYNVVSVSELMEFCGIDMKAGFIYTSANPSSRTTFFN